MSSWGSQVDLEPKVDVLSDEVMLLSDLVPRHVADTITANTITANIAPELSTLRMHDDTVMIRQATPTAVLQKYSENVLRTQQGPRMRAGKVKKLGAGGFGVVWLCKVKGMQARRPRACLRRNCVLLAVQCAAEALGPRMRNASRRGV